MEKASAFLFPGSKSRNSEKKENKDETTKRGYTSGARAEGMSTGSSVLLCCCRWMRARQSVFASLFCLFSFSGITETLVVTSPLLLDRGVADGTYVALAAESLAQRTCSARAHLARPSVTSGSSAHLAHAPLRPLRGLPPGARVPSSVYLYSGESARDCCYRARHLELPEEISRNSRGRRPRGANQFEEGAAVHCSAGYIFLLFFSAPVVCWEPFPLGARSFVFGQ